MIIVELTQAEATAHEKAQGVDDHGIEAALTLDAVVLSGLDWGAAAQRVAPQIAAARRARAKIAEATRYEIRIVEVKA